MGGVVAGGVVDGGVVDAVAPTEIFTVAVLPDSALLVAVSVAIPAVFGAV